MKEFLSQGNGSLPARAPVGSGAVQADAVQADADGLNGATASAEDSPKVSRSQVGIRRAALLTALMISVDVVGIGAGHMIAALLADVVRTWTGAEAISWSLLQERIHEILILSALMIGIFAFGGLYQRTTWESDEIRRICTAVALVALFDAALQFIMREHYSRIWFLTAYPTIMLSIMVTRMSIRALPFIRTLMTSHVILFGNGVSPNLFIGQLGKSRGGPVRLLRTMPLDRIDDGKSLKDMLDRLARNAGIARDRLTLMLAPSPDETRRSETIMELLNTSGLPYSVVLPFTGLARNGLDLYKIIGSDMILIELGTRQWDALARFVKRALDMAVAAVSLILLLPILLAISLALLPEGGPILFRQSRVGRRGRRFTCYKFRSMQPDAEVRLESLLASNPEAREEWDAHQKFANDPRITRFGAFLRKTSLDEIPQFFNILNGDMSLVGPRPIIAPELPGYRRDRLYLKSEEARFYLSVRPGVTGLWQVSGRASTLHEERVRLDQWYARNQSFWLDITILLKTFHTVLTRKGSR